MPNTTLLDDFLQNVEKHGDRLFMTQPMGDDKLQTWTFRQTLDEAKKMASYIQSLNLPAQSQIAICSKNCAWWILADLAIWMTGHVSVPVYPTLTKETTQYILEHSEAQLLFVGKLDEHPWQEMKNGIPSGLKTVSFPLSPADSAQTTWADALKGQKPLAEPAKRTADEMATIIYTSGSTGQ